MEVKEKKSQVILVHYHLLVAKIVVDISTTMELKYMLDTISHDVSAKIFRLIDHTPVQIQKYTFETRLRYGIKNNQFKFSKKKLSRIYLSHGV